MQLYELDLRCTGSPKSHNAKKLDFRSEKKIKARATGIFIFQTRYFGALQDLVISRWLIKPANCHPFEFEVLAVLLSRRFSVFVSIGPQASA